MTNEEQKMLARINKYAENVLGDIDPQKTQVSFQLEKLKPVMEEIAQETGLSLSDVFIKYMDLASEAACASEAKLQESLKDLNEGNPGAPPLLF